MAPQKRLSYARFRHPQPKKRPIVRKTTLKGDPSRRKGKGKNTNKGKGKNQTPKGAQGDQGGDHGKGRKKYWGNSNSWNSNAWGNWPGWENRQTQQADQPAEATAQVNKKKGDQTTSQ